MTNSRLSTVRKLQPLRLDSRTIFQLKQYFNLLVILRKADIKMAIDRNKMYMVFSENAYPVYFPAKDGDFMFEKASKENPSMRQVHFDDIVRVNSSSTLFRDGTLRFEKEYEEGLYTELRIPEWRDIWKNDDIVRILQDPTMEEIERIINFQYQNVFNRVRGIFTGMLNAGEEISSKARTAIEKRQEELEKGIFKSRINVAPKANTQDEVEALKKMVADLAAKVDEQGKSAEPVKVAPKVKEAEPDVVKEEKKPATTKKTTRTPKPKTK